MDPHDFDSVKNPIKIEMKKTRLVKLTLSRFERELIRKHGYPFAGIAAALDVVHQSQDSVIVPCDRYEVELLLGDLAISINEIASSIDEPPDYALQDQLNELYEYIEAEAAFQLVHPGSSVLRGY